MQIINNSVLDIKSGVVINPASNLGFINPSVPGDQLWEQVKADFAALEEIELGDIVVSLLPGSLVVITVVAKDFEIPEDVRSNWEKFLFVAWLEKVASIIEDGFEVGWKPPVYFPEISFSEGDTEEVQDLVREYFPEVIFYTGRG